MINKLANWGQDTLNKAYSANMSFQPMRVMAGFSKVEGRHFNPRTTVEPPEELQNLIFLFALNKEQVLNAVESNDRSNNKGCTLSFAIYFL